MAISGIIFASCSIFFTAFAVLVQVEQAKSRRLVGGTLRTFLDNRIKVVEEKWVNNWKHVSKYILQLGWYYSIHSLLKTVLQVLVSTYTYIEHIFERNRMRTKQLRKEFKKHVAQTHLTHIAHHKEKTTLTQKEQKDLLTRKLEQDH